MGGGLRKRILQGVAANGFGQIITSVINLVQVPLLLSVLGQAGYADWLLLSAIPAQLSISDLGFGAAATSEMARLTGKGDYDQARRTFQSSLALVTATSLAVFLAASTAVLLLPWASFLRLHATASWEANGIALGLIALTVSQQQLSLVAAAYKSSHKYAYVTVCENWIRLAQAAGSLLVVMTTGSLAGYAASYVTIYLIGVVWLSLDLRRHAPWAHWGFGEASWDVIRPLIKPAISFMAFPVALAINQQGFLNLVNWVLGGTALVAWSSLRTLSRIIVQATQSLLGPSWVELSNAIGKDDWNLARRLHGSFLQIGLASSTILGAGIMLACPLLYPIYVHGKVAYQPWVMFLLLVAAAAWTAWNVGFTVAMSANRHTRLTVTCLAVNGLGLLVGAAMGRLWGLPGIALSLVLIESALVPLTWRSVLPFLGETLQGLAGRLTANPLKQLAGRKQEAASD